MDEMLGPDAQGAIDAVSALLGGLDTDGQRAVGADLGRWLERWAGWIKATGSWDTGGC